MQSVNRLRPSNDILLQSELSRLIADKQQEISTGRRLEKPSDDPASWSQVSEISKHQANISSWLRNVERAEGIAGRAENVMDEINNQLTRVNELLIQASSDTLSLENRELIAIELEALEASLSDLIDSRDGFGNALFEDSRALEIPIDDDIRIAITPTKTAFAELSPTMLDIIAAVRTGDEIDRSDELNILNQQMIEMTNLLGSQGIIGNKLEQTKSHLEERQLDLSIFRSSVEDADLTQSIASMQKLLVNLQAAQATYAQIQQSSLFDVLR